MDGAAERKEVEDFLEKHDMQKVMNGVINDVIKTKSEVPYEDIAGGTWHPWRSSRACGDCIVDPQASSCCVSSANSLSLRL